MNGIEKTHFVAVFAKEMNGGPVSIDVAVGLDQPSRNDFVGCLTIRAVGTYDAEKRAERALKRLPENHTDCLASFRRLFEGAHWSGPEDEALFVLGTSVEVRAKRLRGSLRHGVAEDQVVVRVGKQGGADLFILAEDRGGPPMLAEDFARYAPSPADLQAEQARASMPKRKEPSEPKEIHVVGLVAKTREHTSDPGRPIMRVLGVFEDPKEAVDALLAAKERPLAESFHSGCTRIEFFVTRVEAGKPLYDEQIFAPDTACKGNRIVAGER